MDTALITGASSGLGWHFALELARRGRNNLWLVARREDRLQGLCGEIERIWAAAGGSAPKTVRYSVTDLTDQAARRRLISEVSSSGVEIGLLVNNAGFGTVGMFNDSDPDRQLSMIELNCIAPIDLSRAFVPAMCSRGRGGVINVCSTAAYQPMPFMSVYGSTKAFLLSHSVALAAEVRRFGVKVLGHCPGPTESEFHLAAGLTEKLSHLPSADTRTVVVEALNAFESGQVVLINGLRNRILAFANRLMPRFWAARIVERILRH